MANRDLLKEAIADAKAVKETAIANAKAALEEAFTPMLREKLAAKIAEMDEVEEEVDLKEVDEMEEGLEEAEVEEGKTHSLDDYGKVKNVDDYTDDYPKLKNAAKYGDDEAEETEVNEVDLDELLRELESMDEDEMYEDETMEEGKMKKDEDKKDLKEEEEGLLNDPKTPTAHGNVAEEEKEEETEEEEIDLENMDEDDLKKFIEDVIADMVEAGELEAGHEGMKGEEGEEGEESEESEEVEAKVNETEKKMDEMKKELDEAYSALATIKEELNEVNLFNAKLLYTNKIFKAKNLTESQKVKVLAAFDKATSVNEAKLVFETLSEGFKEKKSPVNESMLRGSASKPAGIVEKKPILEVNNQFARWQQLAGIKK